ncbi:MAG: Gram-negative bacterial TonB protein C-terminal [Candidatus Eremiobacteraeota bacterium]|nr:Gram-negative bacterial TonB protein C-terminal [Candidatus Eremiobacteraeota bacterium]
MLPRPSFPVDDPDERALLSSIIRVEHRPTPPPVHQVVQQRPVAKAAPVDHTDVPVIHAAVTVEHAARKLVVATEHRAAYAPSPTEVRKREPNPSLVTHLAFAAPKPAAVADAGPSSAPVASPAPSPVAAQREEGIGNFSETYPASIEPSARAPLFAGVNGVTVRITVDENGRATSIEFLRPPADAALREELRARLLALHFIPAACNGLRCAGTVELKN